jgi:hypothetical protein
MKFQIGDKVESHVSGAVRLVIEGNSIPAYNRETGEETVVSKFVADFYKGLIENGIDEETAYSLTSDLLEITTKGLK